MVRVNVGADKSAGAESDKNIRFCQFPGVDYDSRFYRI